MINVGFKLTAKDLKKLEDFKHSVAYGTYLKCIKSSPVYVSVMKEHVERVNIDVDVNRLKLEGQLPENVPAETISSLFRQSISRMAINIVADSVILKELEEKSVDDVINGIKEDINILYLTGMADQKYYKEAQKLLEDGKLSRNDVAYRGLMAWMKRNEKTPVLLPEKITEPEASINPVKTSIQTKKQALDIDSLDIDV